MVRPTLTALALAAALWPLATTAAPARDLFDDIYARSRGIEASLKTVTARFTESTTSSMLDTPVVVHGTLAVARPDRIVLRYEEPEPHTVLIDGDRMTFSWPSRGIVQRSDIGTARKRIDKYFVDKNPDQLRHAFKITAAVARDRQNAWQIRMDPTRSQITQGLARLDLWIDRSSMLLSAMRMEFPNGDSKLMTFEDVRTNVAIDPAVFSLEGGVSDR
jgi:outer membrane lipoprotein-sorting protein